MANKLYDIAVKTGTYQKGGETKSRYENIGVVMDSGDGPFILLKRTFNPAGVPDLKGDNSDMLLASMFEPQAPQQQQQQGGFQQQQQQGGFAQQPGRTQQNSPGFDPYKPNA